MFEAARMQAIVALPADHVWAPGFILCRQEIIMEWDQEKLLLKMFT